MAASFVQRTNQPCKMISSFALLLIVSLLHAGVMAQEEVEVATEAVIPEDVAVAAEAFIRGDMIFTEAPGPTGQTTAGTTAEDAGDNNNSGAVTPEDPANNGPEFNVQIFTEAPRVTNTENPAPMPPRGDGPDNRPQVVPQDDVVCVSKEAVQNKNAVNLKLKDKSTCTETKGRIESVLQELCGEDCKLELYQEDDTDEIIVSGKYVEDDVTRMTDMFNNDNIKDKTNVKEANPRFGSNSKLVLVSLLLTGLLLAALLVGGYYLKTHRKNSKGVRLAESFQVDEENQANTLVSVAPLPQEPLDKPTVNGDSPPENGTNPAPTTNGHSATQAPVADTEM